MKKKWKYRFGKGLWVQLHVWCDSELLCQGVPADLCLCWSIVYCVFDTVPVCVYVCQWMSASTCFRVQLSVCVFICALYMSGWLCMCLLAFVHGFVLACLSLYVCVFPWAFRVSLCGLVLLIRLCVWGHGCRVGLHHGDPGTDGGQSLLPHSCEEGDRYCMDERGRKRAWILFALPFLSFFTPPHPLFPNPPFLSVRICKEFHKISPFTRLCLVCVCVSYYMRILRESSVNTSSSAWSHDLGLSHSKEGFFLWKSSGRINLSFQKSNNTVTLHLSLKYWHGGGDNFTYFCYLILQNCNY